MDEICYHTSRGMVVWTHEAPLDIPSWMVDLQWTFHWSHLTSPSHQSYITLYILFYTPLEIKHVLFSLLFSTKLTIIFFIQYLYTWLFIKFMINNFANTKYIIMHVINEFETTFVMIDKYSFSCMYVCMYITHTKLHRNICFHTCSF